jgi:hypothetical protein
MLIPPVLAHRSASAHRCAKATATGLFQFAITAAVANLTLVDSTQEESNPNGGFSAVSLPEEAYATPPWDESYGWMRKPQGFQERFLGPRIPMPVMHFYIFHSFSERLVL